MQFVWKIVEFPETLIVQGIQTSDNLRTAPVRHMEYAETLEVLEFPVVQHIQHALLWWNTLPSACHDLQSTSSCGQIHFSSSTRTRSTSTCERVHDTIAARASCPGCAGFSGADHRDHH